MRIYSPKSGKVSENWGRGARTCDGGGGGVGVEPISEVAHMTLSLKACHSDAPCTKEQENKLGTR